LIFNAGSSYPCVGEDDFGGITFSGNGSFSVSPATTGPYAGIIIYQARNNTRAIEIGGNAIGNISGTIYAPNALLSLKGDASLGGSAIVGTSNLGGSTALTKTAAGSDGSGDIAGISNTLVAGDLFAAGATNRTVTVADLNIPDPPAGVDPQSVLPFPMARRCWRVPTVSVPYLHCPSFTFLC